QPPPTTFLFAPTHLHFSSRRFKSNNSSSSSRFKRKSQGVNLGAARVSSAKSSSIWTVSVHCRSGLQSGFLVRSRLQQASVPCFLVCYHLAIPMD
ncbi:hypothetical protein LINPERPRIM_LOCUS40675, partial [Linum perenne]